MVSHHIRKNLGNSGKTYRHFKVRDGSSAGREMFYPCSQTVGNKRRTADRIMSTQVKGTNSTLFPWNAVELVPLACKGDRIKN